MKKIILSFGGFLAVLLIVGVGCADQTSPTKNSDIDTDQKTTTETVTNKKVTTVTDLKLTAEALGDRTVKFDWEVPEDLAKDAEGYRFARGIEENPEVNKDSWWWERGPAHRELEWQGLPTGQAHFRMCVVKNDECNTYSNSVEVDVK